MRVLITGVCGFVGSALAQGLRTGWPGDSLQLLGIDNLSRSGSERNRLALRRWGIELVHGDLRLPSDLESLGQIDWVVDAAALPSVMAGVGVGPTSRQVVEHNLLSTLNLLELCKVRQAGLILLSTSRVYSVSALASIQVEESARAFALRRDVPQPNGLSLEGIAEEFPTAAPVSLYGATKLASEQLALEYGAAFGFPVRIDRCGVLAGAGQFGRPDQGILAFWINSWLRGRPLRYVGFGGRGLQVRDFLHPRDLVPLLHRQLSETEDAQGIALNIGGGMANALSLAQISAWCEDRFGPRTISSDNAARHFDAPWIVLNSARAEHCWGWRPQTSADAILAEVADHAEQHPEWLEVSCGA